MNPDQQSHPSIMFYDDDTIVPQEQEVPDWCILCPRNKVMRNKEFCHSHYLKVHHKKLIVVQDYKIWPANAQKYVATAVTAVRETSTITAFTASILSSPQIC